MRVRPKSPAVIAVIALLSLALSGCASSPRPVPPGLTEEEIDGIMVQWAAVKSDAYSGHILGPGQDIRFISFLPRGVWVRTLLTCERRLDGVPIETTLYDNASDYARAVCGIQYPAPQLRSRMLTADQLGYLWDYYSVSLIPCLRGFGVSVTGMPSRKSFVESPLGGLDAWSPPDHYNSRTVISAGAKRAIRAKCPLVPDGLPRPEVIPDFLP